MGRLRKLLARLCSRRCPFRWFHRILPSFCLTSSWLKPDITMRERAQGPGPNRVEKACKETDPEDPDRGLHPGSAEPSIGEKNGNGHRSQPGTDPHLSQELPGKGGWSPGWSPDVSAMRRRLEPGASAGLSSPALPKVKVLLLCGCPHCTAVF